MFGKPSEFAEKHRMKYAGTFSSDASFGNNGVFMFKHPLTMQSLKVIVGAGNVGDPETDESDLNSWEHVSVSTPNRTPTWAEMCWVKDIFFSPEETVVQFHPPKSQYVNFHPHCLHMWKHKRYEFPVPSPFMV